MKENQINILIKAWEMYQNLAKGLGESSWKIKTIGIGFWSAIVAYSYKENDNNIYFLSILIVILFFFIESGMRRLQYKYIEKSIEIEKSINDYLVEEDEIRLPSKGITTNVEVPDCKDFFNLFRLKRWIFWFPYLVLLLSSILLCYINFI